MTDDERARILRMVAEGQLSPAEAAELLEAIQPEPRAERRSPEPAWAVPPPAPVPPLTNLGRKLIIQIKEDGETKVDARIPLGLVQAAGKFVPRVAQRHLSKYEIDVEQLVRDLGSSWTEGAILEIKDDEDEVRIAVE